MSVPTKPLKRAARRLGHGLVVLISAPLLAFTFFLVLPLLQTLGERPEPEFMVRSVFTAELPPPPPPEEKPEEEKEEEKEPPPELSDEPPPMDLSALELALNPSYGDGWGAGGISMNLNGLSGDGSKKSVEALFSLADLDQKPRPTYRQSPSFGPQQQRKAPGRVVLLFIVNEHGRVEQPRVQSSTDKVFEAPALQAIKKWKFEPGKRNGESVRFRMRLPITFPKG
ncbi:MAG: energy transducer TonB [Planctomycetes bacterium]|nr:energy transducer TonB [Planctomycetota bacterium]